MLTREEIMRGVNEAERSWHGGTYSDVPEWEMCEMVQDGSIFRDKAEFKKWLKHWMVARNIQNEVFDPVYKHLSDHTLPGILASSSHDLALTIDCENIRLHAAHGCGFRSRLSMISKLAFCARPEEVRPYDRTVKEGLKALFPGEGSRRGAFYTSYSKTLDEVRLVVEPIILNDSEMTKVADRLVSAPLMTRELFLWRVIDKSLMFKGGFDSSKH